MPKISIIIPIYNVEAFLPACLDSVKAQSLQDFEALCIIDGSTDGSLAIAEAYAEADPRFIVLEKPNGGLSSARNHGIEHARGDIVMFLDADDSLETDCCQALAELFDETSAEAAVFGAIVVPEEESTPWFETAFTPVDAVWTGFSAEFMFSDYATPFAWRNAVTREALERTGVRFDESVSFGEDVVFQFALYPRMRCIASSSRKLYRYRVSREGSLMHGHRSDLQRLSSHRVIVERVFEDWRDQGLLEKHGRELFDWSIPYLMRDFELLVPEDREPHIQAVNALWNAYFAGNGIRKLGVATECLCRGDGKFYAECRIESVTPFTDVICRGIAAGQPVPVNAYPLDNAAGSTVQTWALEAPLLDAKALEVTFSVDDHAYEQETVPIRYGRLKWASRLNYRLKPDRCARVRDIERSYSHNRYQVDVLRRFDGDDGTIWRIRVRWMGDGENRPAIAVLDSRGRSMDSRTFFCEFSESDPADASSEHELFLSVEIPSSVEHFVIVASDETGTVRSGFAVIEPARAHALRDETRDRMLSAADDADYQRWVAAWRTAPGALEAQRLSQSPPPISFGILVDARCGTDALLARTIDSLAAQTHGAWKAIVMCGQALAPDSTDYRVNAMIAGEANPFHEFPDTLAGDFLMLLNCGDVLEPDALHALAQAACKAREEKGAAPLAVYADEDAIDADGALSRPLFKSKLNLDLMYCRDWIGRAIAFERHLVTRTDSPVEADTGAWHFECVLKAHEKGARLHYAPKLAMHAYSDSGEHERAAARKPILEAHFTRRNLDANVVYGPKPGSLRVRYAIPEPHPLVSIIIPSKDHRDLLESCIGSIMGKATYDNFEIIIVENNSTSEETFAYYEQIQRAHGNVKVVRWEHEFNYSKIVNFGAIAARGDYLMFLNNDTEVIAPSFIEEMVGMLQRPEVGVVGAKLLFRDGLVQHSGMSVGVWDTIVHVNQNRINDDGGYLDRACLQGEYSSVTGACQAVRTETFELLGGYDEGFAVGFNDADFCMRIQEAGMLVAYTPYALLYHFEFASRGREEGDKRKMLRWKQEQARFIQKWPAPFVGGDPFTSPNLMRDNMHYRLK